MCLASKGSGSWAYAAQGPQSEMQCSMRPVYACGNSQSRWTSSCPPCQSKPDWRQVCTHGPKNEVLPFSQEKMEDPLALAVEIAAAAICVHSESRVLDNSAACPIAHVWPAAMEQRQGTSGDL